MYNMTMVSDEVYQAIEAAVTEFNGDLNDLLEDLTGERPEGDDLCNELDEIESNNDMTVFTDMSLDSHIGTLSDLDDSDILQRLDAMYGAYIELYHLELGGDYVLIVGAR